MILEIDNFIDQNEAKKLITFIDKNIDDFDLSDSKSPYPFSRFMLRFGYDEERPDLIRKNYEILNPILEQLQKIFDDCIDAVSDKFNDDSQLYVTSFFLSKHVPGSESSPHRDSRPGFNEQLDYTILLYLNTLPDNGGLFFPSLNKTIIPETGKLVIFDTKGIDAEHGINKVMQDRYSIPIWLTKDKSFSLPPFVHMPNLK